MVLRGSISELHLYRWEVLLGCPTRAIARQWDNAESHPWREVVEVAEYPWAAWACPWHLIWAAVGAAAGAPCHQESILGGMGGGGGGPLPPGVFFGGGGGGGGGPCTYSRLQSGLHKSHHPSIIPPCMCRAASLPAYSCSCYPCTVSGSARLAHHWTQVQQVCRRLPWGEGCKAALENSDVFQHRASDEESAELCQASDILEQMHTYAKKSMPYVHLPPGDGQHG